MFAFICAVVLALDQWLVHGAGKGNFHFGIRNIVDLFTHAIGHANWPHLIGNFSIILLVGPMLEEN